MAEYIWAVVCQKAVIDKDTNQISLMDVLEFLKIETLDELGADTALAIRLHVATFWTRSVAGEPEKARGQVRLLTPSGKSHTLAMMDINLETSQNCRAILKMEGIPVEGSGQYWFIIEKEDGQGSWEQMARIPLSITVTSSTEIGETSGV